MDLFPLSKQKDQSELWFTCVVCLLYVPFICIHILMNIGVGHTKICIGWYILVLICTSYGAETYSHINQCILYILKYVLSQCTHVCTYLHTLVGM